MRTLLAITALLILGLVCHQRIKQEMSSELSETDKYILGVIHKWVWSGFYGASLDWVGKR